MSVCMCVGDVAGRVVGGGQPGARRLAAAARRPLGARAAGNVTEHYLYILI